VEDAKKVQRLEGHLCALRKKRDFLKHKRVNVSTVFLRVVLGKDEAPFLLGVSGDHHQRVDGVEYRRDRQGSPWEMIEKLEAGKFDFKAMDYENGRIPMLGTCALDAIRAAVLKEIEETEAAIVELGFAFSEDK